MAREMSYAFSLGATLASSFKGAMTSARSQIVGLSRDVRTMEKSSTGRLGSSFEASKNKIRQLGGELKGAKAQLATFQARAAASGGATGTLARQIAQAERRVQTLSGSLRRAGTAHREHVAAIRTEVGSIRQLQRQYRELSAQMDRARSKQRALSANLAARDANRSRRADMRGGLMDVAVMGAAMAVPVKFSIDFEDSMAKVGALARANEEDLARMTAQARQLGRDTVFTAKQAAEGMQFLAMAGFNTEKTMAAMPGLLELAAAGAIDLGRASDISSNILSAYQINAAEMGRVSDVLAKTFTTSNTTLETLGETMKYVGPVASAVNMSLEDTAAAVGLLGNVGIQGSQAGTALRAALLRLSAPPKQAAEALLELTGAGVENLDELMAEVGDAQHTLNKLGIKTKDSAGNLRPMVDVLEELNIKMSNMGSGEKMEKIKKIFGTTASAAMVALMDAAGRTVDDQGNQIVDSYGRKTNALRKYMEDINNAEGTGARIAKQMNDTTGGSLRVMRSAMEDVAIVTGNLFAPAIRTMAGGIVVAANTVSAFIEKFPVLSRVVGLAVGGTIMLTGATMLLGYGYSFVKGGLLLAQAAMLKMTGAQVGAAASARGLTLAQRGMAAATLLAGAATKGVALAFRVLKFAMIGSGIGAILVGVGLAAGYIIENWATVGPFFGRLWDGIVSMAKTAWQFMKTYLWDKNPMMLAPRMIVENWDKIMSALKPVFDWLKDKFSWVTDSFNGLQKAWNFFFGDDDKAGKVSGSSEAAVARMENPEPPLVVQSVKGTLTPPPANDVFGDMPQDPVFNNYQWPTNTTQAPTLSAGAGGLDFLAGLGGADASMANINAGFEGMSQDTAAMNADFAKMMQSMQGLEGSDFFSSMPANYDMTKLPGPKPEVIKAEITNETNITMDLKFDVKGLDEGEFRKKINNYKAEFEKIVRRVVSQMEQTNKRVKFAQ